MRKLTKKLLAVTLTTATLLSGFAIAPTQKCFYGCPGKSKKLQRLLNVC